MAVIATPAIVPTRLPLTVTQTVKSAAAADAKNTQSCGFIESAPETNRQSLELAKD